MATRRPRYKQAFIGMTTKLARWVPAIIWMGLIFAASTDRGSVEHTRPVVVAILERLFPEWAARTPASTLHAIDWTVRKAAHITEYAILTMFFAFALPRRNLGKWPGVFVWSGPILYAVSDETHQSTVPGRWATPGDVLIDAIGVITVSLTLASRRKGSGQNG